MLRRHNGGPLCGPCDSAAGRTDSAAPLGEGLPPDFYRRPDVAAALAAYDFAAFFRAVRAELGLSQEAFGLHIGLDQSRVCKIETGTQRLRDVETVARIARICAAPAGLLGFAPAPPGSPAPTQVVSWLERRDFLTVVAGLALGITGPVAAVRLDELVPLMQVEPLSHVAAADVARIETATAAFRSWDNQRGGGVSRAAVTAQLQWVVATARRATCISEAVHKRLLTATADLAALVAFTHYDVENHEDARRLWLVALDAAHRADNADLMSKVLREMAHQALHLDRPDEALRLVQVAATTALATTRGEAAPSTLAETAAYEGWAHAMVGRVQPCLRALGRAEDVYAGTSTADPTPWMVHFDAAELNALRGHCLHVLANHRPEVALQAQSLLRAAVDGRRAEHVRRRTLNQIALAATYFQSGRDLDEGIVVGHQALAGGSSLSSPRVRTRWRGLETVTRPFARQGFVADFRRELEPVLAG
jgi:transcriptional regulator with XRE-family HTH domain